MDYSVSDYSIFSDACSSTTSYINNVSTTSEAVDKCDTTLSDQSIFMGPIADNCKQEITGLKESLTTFATDFTTLTQFIVEVDAKYKQGDQDAANTILGVGGAGGVDSKSSVNSDGIINTSVLGDNYSLVNTKTSFNDFYQDVVQGKNLYQKSGGYSDWCLGFACTHAWGMYSGNSNYKASQCNNSCEATNHFSRYKTNDKSEFMNKVYSELSNGRPVVMQVCGSKSRGTRHYVTAVGYKNNVTSASNLKDTDLLIIDSYDGKAESVVPSGSSGDGRYIIRGTDTSNYKNGDKNYNYGYELYTIST